MRLVDLFIRVGADTSSAERGMSGAQKALVAFERSADKAGEANEKLLGSLDANGQRLLQIAQASGGATKGLSDVTRSVIAASGGMEKYTAIVAAMNAESGRTAQIVEVQSSAFSKIDLEAGKGRLAVGRLGNQFGTLISQATGVPPVLTNIAGVLGTFATGALASAGILAGLAALAFAFNEITKEGRQAGKELSDLAKKWNDRAAAQFAATAHGVAIEIDKLNRRVAQLHEELRTGPTLWEKLRIALYGIATGGDFAGEALRIAAGKAKKLQEANSAVAAATAEHANIIEQKATPAVRGLTNAWDDLTKALERAHAAGQRALGTVSSITPGPRTAGDVSDIIAGRPTGGADWGTIARGAATTDQKIMTDQELYRRELERIQEASKGTQSSTEKVREAINIQTVALQAAMLALGDKILLGGGGAGSRTAGGIGGMIGGALGLGGGPLGKVFGAIVGTGVGSLIGGLFDKPKKAADAFAQSLDRATASATNIPQGFFVEDYRPVPTITMPGGGGGAPISIGVVNINGVSNMAEFERELRRKATSGGIVFPGIVPRGGTPVGGGFSGA